MELKKIILKDICKLGLFEVLHILSVDIALGSLAGGILAARILNVNPGFAFWVILPIAVWLLYSLDHLIDGLKLRERAHTVRHFYHFHYANRIIAVMIFLLLIMIPLVFFYLEKSIIQFGVFVASIAGVYFLIVYFFGDNNSFFVQKEFSVALIYTFGIWGGPASLMVYNINPGQLVLIIAFFISVFIAVIIFSLYEEDTDRIDNHTTLVTRFGDHKVKYFLYFLFLLLFVLSISQIIFANQIIYVRAAKLLMLMGGFLLMIMSFPEILRQKKRYRFLVELVFWLPGLAYWL